MSDSRIPCTANKNLGLDAFQEADVTGITYAVVKHSYLVKDAGEIPRATREAFASSVLWSAEPAAERDDGSLLVELTDFLLSDAHDIAGTLKSSGQGAFSLDAKRSTIEITKPRRSRTATPSTASASISGSRSGSFR